MRKDWLEHVVKEVARALHDFALQFRLSHWRPISTAPCNQDVELRIVEERNVVPLQFPCRRMNAGEWINADLGTRIQIKPVEWRIWQRSKSPKPHFSPVRLNGRVALLRALHTGDQIIEWDSV